MYRYYEYLQTSTSLSSNVSAVGGTAAVSDAHFPCRQRYVLRPSVAACRHT
jgi:hypothetical protein